MDNRPDGIYFAFHRASKNAQNTQNNKMAKRTQRIFLRVS